MHVVAVNAANAKDNQQALLDVADLPMLQDTDAVKAWEAMGGGKDDLYLYGAQGKLVQYFKMGGAVDTNLGSDENYAKFKQAVVEAMGK